MLTRAGVFFQCGRHLYIPPLSRPLRPSAPRSHPPTPVQLVSAPLHCSIELFYYEIPFGMMEAWWVVILSGDLKLHHFNINFSSLSPPDILQLIHYLPLIVSRCTRVYHNDVVVVDLWTSLNSSMYQNSFIGSFFPAILSKSWGSV